MTVVGVKLQDAMLPRGHLPKAHHLQGWLGLILARPP